MAFFNLTALGPANIFLDKRKGQSKLYLFNNEDLEYAFKITAKGGGETVEFNEYCH